MTEKINVVFMGGFGFPRGMAGTRRIQNVIDALKDYPHVSARVILQHQSPKNNTLSGVYEGTPYETVMADLTRAGMLAALPLLYYRTNAALKRAFRPGHKNIIYFYGPLFLDSIVPLSRARKMGYRIVFDVIEDFGLIKAVSRTSYQHVKGRLANLLSLRIRDLAAGIVVISSYLEDKCKALTRGRMPLLYMPISVNMALFPLPSGPRSPSASLFYAGSFGKKDGLPVLLDVFDRLAERYPTIRIVLTGRGDREAMEEFSARRELSPNKDRIDFRGYLDEKEYYALLNSVDIPCMTRVDLAFAHAGFPFKLGEFLATGKPVIASRVSDVDRFLVNGQNAMLVQPGSVAEVCAAAEYLIDNPESAGAIGARGREVAESFLDHKQQGKALLRFLESM